jgi:integrase
MIKRRSYLPKHVICVKDRHGKLRYRFRRSSFTAYIHGTPSSEEFKQRYWELRDSTTPPTNVGAERTKAGSFNALAVSYYNSPGFRDLADSTKTMRRRIIDKFRVEHGDKPIRLLQRKHVADFMAERAETPEAANNLVKLLKVMLNHAVDLGMIDSNPAARIKRYRSKGKGFHTWTEEEIAKFEAAHPIGTKARLAFALLLYSGQRVSDVCKMGWQHIVKTAEGDVIKVRQQKTGTPLEIPLHPKLEEFLATEPRTNMTFLVTKYGALFTAQGLGTFVKKACVAAGLRHCSAHGLRSAAVTRLIDACCPDEQLKAFTGHRSASALAPYKRGGDQRKLARQAMTMQLRAERERELSNLDPQIVQPKIKRL